MRDKLRFQTGDNAVGVAGEFGEVLLPPGGDGSLPGLGVDLRPAVCAPVEAGKHVGDLRQVARDVVVAAHHRRQPPLIGVAAHHDHRLGNIALRGLEVPDAQIAGRSQPAVEPHLVHARAFTGSRCGEIEEVGSDRFLHLVGQLTDEDHQAGVGIGDLRKQHRSERRVGVICHVHPFRR